MIISEFLDIIEGKVVCGTHLLNHDVKLAFASDLMSDVLTIKEDNVLLITGLANVQAIRTAEMSNIHCVVLVRNKKVTEEMIRLAEDSEMLIIETPYTMFRTSGLLFQAGIKPIY
jgi:predicted transcriptional regulator